MKTVLAHGTFDLLHSGHIEYLEFAKKQGDSLTVALSSDSMAQKRKGKQRPIMPFTMRKKVVGALKAVDKVIEAPYPTDDLIKNLMQLVRTRRPTIFVSSYSDFDERFHEEMAGIGVRFVHAPIFGKTTTTDIIKRILSRYDQTTT